MWVDKNMGWKKPVLPVKMEEDKGFLRLITTDLHIGEATVVHSCLLTQSSCVQISTEAGIFYQLTSTHKLGQAFLPIKLVSCKLVKKKNFFNW